MTLNHDLKARPFSAAHYGPALGCFLLAVVAGWVGAAAETAPAGPAAPAGPGAPAGPAAPAEDPLNAYVRQLGDEQRARIASIVQAAGADAPSRQSALQEALQTLNPDLARAFDALNADRVSDALPLLEQLAGAADPFLATYAVWLRVRGLVAGERFEDALAALTAVQAKADRYSLLAGDMLYTEGVLRACLIERPAATRILQRYLKQYPQAPAERREAAQEVLDQIKRVRPAELDELPVLMNDSRRRLRLLDCGEQTLARQKQIVGVLDKAIEKAELKMTGASSANTQASGGGGGKSKGKKSNENQQGKQSSGKGGQGAKESRAPEGQGDEVELSEPVSGSAPDDWAKAYARERETVKRELQTRVPERYRDLLEQYYRSLAAADGTETEAKERK